MLKIRNSMLPVKIAAMKIQENKQNTIFFSIMIAKLTVVKNAAVVFVPSQLPVAVETWFCGNDGDEGSDCLWKRKHRSTSLETAGANVSHTLIT
jgi:hypothetical protein